MEIDRRALLLTGLAATAAAASLPAFAEASVGRPALPTSAAVRDVLPLFFDGPIFCGGGGVPHASRPILFNALWHFNPGHDGLWVIRHVSTGITCGLAPQPDDPHAVKAFFFEVTDELWPGPDDIALIGPAARFVALHASLVHGCRAHAGAIYFRYTQCNPKDPFDLPDTEDAPALLPDSMRLGRQGRVTHDT